MLITTGSQQGLDLLAKVLIDEGSRMLVETPDLPGRAAGLRADGARGGERGTATTKAWMIDDLARKAQRRALSLRAAQLPEPDRPHHDRGAPRRAVGSARPQLGLPLVEDNPYGDLWFDAPPPAPLTARNPDGCVYLGSFSKVLAPGLRLGFLVAPKALYPKLLQAKQAADLHSPGFNQRMVAEVMKDGFLDRHVPTIRALYKSQRDAMLAALRARHARPDVSWNTPGRRHVPVGAPARGHGRRRAAAQGGRAQRGLRAGRGVLCRPRRPAHPAPVAS